MLRTFLLRCGAVRMIEAAARGAWRDLEAKLRPFIRRRVRAEADIDDVLQDVFLRIQRGLPALRDEERFGPWVYQVARSAIVDHLRLAAKRPALRETLQEEMLELEGDEGSVERELAGYLASFVAELPSPYREALTLTELEGLTQQQAAAMLDITLSGMKSRVQRGRQKLRQALDECCHIALDARGGVMACEPRPDGKAPERCCR